MKKIATTVLTITILGLFGVCVFGAESTVQAAQQAPADSFCQCTTNCFGCGGRCAPCTTTCVGDCR